VSVLLRGKIRAERSMELVGCSIDDLWIHLEGTFKKGMTRNNYGLWHVDHCKPCASFDLNDPLQQKKCFHYSNLQALWAIDNLKKGSKWKGKTYRNAF
jgi:hypothetical protein